MFADGVKCQYEIKLYSCMQLALKQEFHVKMLQFDRVANVNVATFVLQNYPLSKFCSLKAPKLSLFTRFYWGKIWFEDFPPCKRFDILQLCEECEQQKGNKLENFDSRV